MFQRHRLCQVATARARSTQQEPLQSRALHDTPRGAGRILAALTAVHTVNDFYGLVLPPLLPVLRTAFDLSYGQVAVVPFVSTGLSAILQPTLGSSRTNVSRASRAPAERQCLNILVTEPTARNR